MKLSEKSLGVLAWLRDNEHHTGEWLPVDSKPCESTHIKISGKSERIVVEARVWNELGGLFYYAANNRMFMPNEDALKYLEESRV